MPPELMELYNLYQMEIETRENNEKDQNLLVEAEKILRTPSMVSLRPELDEDDNVAYGSDDHKLPPIVREQQNDRLFSRRNADDSDSEADTREMDSRMSIRNIDSSESKGRANSTLPRIERDSGGATRDGSKFNKVQPLPPIRGSAGGPSSTRRSSSLTSMSAGGGGGGTQSRSRIPRRTTGRSQGHQHQRLRRRNSLSGGLPSSGVEDERRREDADSPEDGGGVYRPFAPGADSPEDGGVYRPFAPGGGGGRRYPSAQEEEDERAAAALDLAAGNRKHNRGSKRTAVERKHTDPFQNVGIPISRY